MVLKGNKWSQNFQYGLKWSSMVPNGPKWSKKNDHKFNRMSFITRFNLVLVWSKIVQILTKKSSKWVWHNQVSWSSFITPISTHSVRDKASISMVKQCVSNFKQMCPWSNKGLLCSFGLFQLFVGVQ